MKLFLPIVLGIVSLGLAIALFVMNRNDNAQHDADVASTTQDLAQLGKDYVALDNRFHIDVGERMVIERKFRNLAELKAQMQQLKKYPAGQLTEFDILAGLDVEVRSNGVYHVITPN